jgi:ribosomal protein S18 acetylase RimI-like enzyme
MTTKKVSQSEHAKTSSHIKIRRTVAEDRPALLDILSRTQAFRPHEVAVAVELIDEFLEAGEQSGYTCLTALEEGSPRVAGYACYGPTPLTDRLYDLYWIATDPALGRKGVGAALLQHVERVLAEAGARKLIIETDSNPLYESAVKFYLKQGYIEEARIKDFYADGNDKLMFTKRLRPSQT